jgi:hypothetical protein
MVSQPQLAKSSVVLINANLYLSITCFGHNVLGYFLVLLYFYTGILVHVINPQHQLHTMYLALYAP